MEARVRKDHRLWTRFWSKFRPGPNGCWIWTGSLDKDGYGKFWYQDTKGNGKVASAHRVAFELDRNRPIPQGWHLTHTCARNDCINPRHIRRLPPSEQRWGK